MEIDVSERSRIAMEYFREGYNCAQSVVLAFQDITGVQKDILANLACGLGGGVGRMREVCGTVSAIGLLASYLVRDKADSIQKSKSDAYAVVQQLAEKFKSENGSIVCRDLLGLRIEQKNDPRASSRTPEYYKARPCEALVGYSASIIAEFLKENS